MKKIIHLLVTLIFTFACTPVFAEEAATNCEDGSNCNDSSIVVEEEADPVTEDDGAAGPLIISEETLALKNRCRRSGRRVKTWTTQPLSSPAFFVLIIAAYFHY